MAKINIFLLFLLAPLVGLVLVFAQVSESAEGLLFPSDQVNVSINHLVEAVDDLNNDIVKLGFIVEEQKNIFDAQSDILTGLTELSEDQKDLSEDIYENKILEMLGPAVAVHNSENNAIKIFKLDELGYRGYIAKVKLFKYKSFKVTLAKGELGQLETTSAAAKRTEAIFAINGGGFYTEKRDGKTYAQLIGNTVIDGELVEKFNGYPGDLFFVGINTKGGVIGNVPKKEKEITDLDPYQGVSFIPVLIKEGEKVDIPSKWKNTKQPRTIIGKYANDDLIMIVIDGRQNDWSVGVSLERLQDKLIELGVKDAYNLDGGGSSAMYFDGAILNKPSGTSERSVANNIVILP